MIKVFARPRSQPRKKLFYGWWIVIAGSISQAYTSGAFWQGFGAFFDAIVEQFGWSRAVTSAAVSLQRTESGMISPFVGWFIDKFGPRNVMLAGIVVTGFGFIFLSRINSLWQFYAAFVVITLGLSFGTFLVVTTSVANWFIALRGRALSITFAGSALGGVMVPLIVLLINATDWRMGLLVIGIGFWVMGIPIAFVMRSRPEDYGQYPDGRKPHVASQSNTSDTTTTPEENEETNGEVEFTTRQALKTRSFWQMVLAMGSGQLIMSASVHQIPAMSSFGFSLGTAALVIMGVSLMSLVGRLGSGFLGDIMDKRKVIALAFAAQLIGTVLFALTTSIWFLLVFIVFWGLGFGGSIPLRFALIADYFGRRHFGSIMGIMMTTSTIFGVIGPVFVGWMVDVRGNYREPFLILSASILIGIPLILGLKEPRKVKPKPRAIEEKNVIPTS